ncbi:MAG: ferritin-like domain-containing protein [Chitinophagaceae bacterium]
MEKQLSAQRLSPPEHLSSEKKLDRRKFLSYVGISASVITAAAACTKTQTSTQQDLAKAANQSLMEKSVFGDRKVIDLGSGDIGILNYAYALEQLEAAFYTRVVSSFYSGIGSWEKAFLQDVQYHEVAHREFFKTALGNNAIPELTFNFSSIDFSGRLSVLKTAKAFEDTGVSAYNGAGKLISNPDYLLLAGKIVSVEARHAAYFRDLLDYNSFADNTVVDSNGLDTSRSPQEVLTIVDPYIKEKLNGDHLPTN